MKKLRDHGAHDPQEDLVIWLGVFLGVLAATGILVWQLVIHIGWSIIVWSIVAVVAFAVIAVLYIAYVFWDQISLTLGWRKDEDIY